MSSLKWFGLGLLVIVVIMVASGLLAKGTHPKQHSPTLRFYSGLTL